MGLPPVLNRRYDAVAIFSGSTTIVDGKPIIVYPGLCKRGLNGCTGTDCEYRLLVVPLVYPKLTLISP